MHKSYEMPHQVFKTLEGHMYDKAMFTQTSEGPKLSSQTDFEALLKQEVKAKVEFSARLPNIESDSNKRPLGNACIDCRHFKKYLLNH